MLECPIVSWRALTNANPQFGFAYELYLPDRDNTDASSLVRFWKFSNRDIACDAFAKETANKCSLHNVDSTISELKINLMEHS